MRLIMILLTLPSICLSNTIIQIKDFLCGCNHCATVSTGEPLDIASHMILCESQREGMLKTIEIMNRTKKPELPKLQETDKIKTNEDMTKHTKQNKENFSWNKDAYGDWQYSNQVDQSNLTDSWIYKPRIGWLWCFNKNKFLYSEKFGWLYNKVVGNKRIFYWYDRRKWILSRDLSKQE